MDDFTTTYLNQCMTFDLQNLIRSSGVYFLSVLSKLFKPFTRYRCDII